MSTAYHYLCTVVDTTTNECTTGTWVPYEPWTGLLPTLEQANNVGWTAFASIVILAAVLLLRPSKEKDE